MCVGREGAKDTVDFVIWGGGDEGMCELIEKGGKGHLLGEISQREI